MNTSILEHFGRQEEEIRFLTKEITALRAALSEAQAKIDKCPHCSDDLKRLLEFLDKPGNVRSS